MTSLKSDYLSHSTTTEIFYIICGDVVTLILDAGAETCTRIIAYPLMDIAYNWKKVTVFDDIEFCAMNFLFVL